MNSSDTPAHGRSSGEISPDEIDRMLKRLFEVERPSPWPMAPQPQAAASIRRKSADSLRAGRLMLAVSLAAVLLGGWLLAGRMSRPIDRPATFDDTTATRPAELRPPPVR